MRDAQTILFALLSSLAAARMAPNSGAHRQQAMMSARELAESLASGGGLPEVCNRGIRVDGPNLPIDADWFVPAEATPTMAAAAGNDDELSKVEQALEHGPVRIF